MRQLKQATVNNRHNNNKHKFWTAFRVFLFVPFASVMSEFLHRWRREIVSHQRARRGTVFLEEKSLTCAFSYSRIFGAGEGPPPPSSPPPPRNTEACKVCAFGLLNQSQDPLNGFGKFVCPFHAFCVWKRPITHSPPRPPSEDGFVDIPIKVLDRRPSVVPREVGGDRSHPKILLQISATNSSLKIGNWYCKMGAGN